MKFGKNFYGFKAWRKNGEKSVGATNRWLKMHRVFMLFEIIDVNPDIKVVVIDEDQKTRPEKKVNPQHEYAPQESGVVILSTVLKCFKDGIFYCHNVDFMQFGQYVMRFTLVAPAATVARMLVGGKKVNGGRYDNFSSQDPEIITQKLQERQMEAVSKPFNYAVDLLREKVLSPRGHCSSITFTHITRARFCLSLL